MPLTAPRQNRYDRGVRVLRLVIVLWIGCCSVAEARDLQAAKQHYRKAAQAFAKGAFKEAADEYVLAYQASDDPLLLYNIGVSLRLSEQRPQALRAFRMYL